MIFENCILNTYFLTPWPTYNNSVNFNMLGPLHGMELSIFFLYEMGYHDKILIYTHLKYLNNILIKYKEHFVIYSTRNNTYYTAFNITNIHKLIYTSCLITHIQTLHCLIVLVNDTTHFPNVITRPLWWTQPDNVACCSQ